MRKLLSVTNLAVLCVISLGAATLAQAQGYPNRPLRIIVPYATGGGADALARLLGPRLSERLGQQVIVDNRPGGATIIGTDAAAKSKPDGYTMVLVTITHAVNATLVKKLPYDSLKDFAPVIQIYAQPLVAVTHPSLPVKTIRQLIDLARARPGQISFASSGEGGGPHLAGELFRKLAKVDIVHIPYKGSAPATMDVLGGHVPLMFAPVITVTPFLKSTRLNALAVTASRRIQALSHLPTMAESGIQDYEIGSWTGILFPAGTPQEIVEKINAEIQRLLDNPALKETLTAEGSEIVGGSAAEFARFLRVEIDKWAGVLQRPL